VGAAVGADAGVLGAATESLAAPPADPPAGNASPRSDARSCSTREWPALHRTLSQLSLAERVGVAALDLVADLVEVRGGTGRGDLAHRP
jgi:hypothetical protein